MKWKCWTNKVNRIYKKNFWKAFINKNFSLEIELIETKILPESQNYMNLSNLSFFEFPCFNQSISMSFWWKSFLNNSKRNEMKTAKKESRISLKQSFFCSSFIILKKKDNLLLLAKKLLWNMKLMSFLGESAFWGIYYYKLKILIYDRLSKCKWEMSLMEIFKVFIQKIIIRIQLCKSAEKIRKISCDKRNKSD